MNQQANTHNLEGLDALRGLLSVIVCMAHAWQIFINPVTPGNQSLALAFGLPARLAVIGFFCLSGYVISLSIQRNIHRHGHFKGSDFVSARFFRIAPPLLFAVLLVLFLAAVIHQLGFVNIPTGVQAARNTFTVHFRAQAASLFTLCLRGDLTGYLNGPLWSLTYEIQLYILYGLLAYLFWSGSRLHYKVLAVVCLVYYWRHAVKEDVAFNLQLVCYLCFLFGAVAFRLGRKIPRAGLWWACAFTSAAGIAFALLYAGGHFIADLDTATDLLMMQTLLGAAFAFAVIIVAKADHFRNMAAVGKYSYTLYIIHFPTMLFVYFLLFHVQPALLDTFAWLWAVLMPVATIFLAKVASRSVENAKGHRIFCTSLALRQFGKFTAK